MKDFRLPLNSQIKTEQRCFAFRTAYINHIERLSNKGKFSINMIINECLNYSLYSDYFKVNDKTIIYDESKYYDNASIKTTNKSVRIRKDLYEIANNMANKYNVTINKVINEAVKFALANYKE